MSVVLGIDTGGTFTDFVLVDEDRGAITTAKVPSTPGDPAAAIAAGLARLEGVERVERLVIGTTVATNAVLERRGPTIVYITNRGSNKVHDAPHGPGSISVLDFATRKVVANWPIPGGGSPDMGNVTADGKQFWVSGRFDGVVYVFDTATGAVKQIPVGVEPHGLTVWPQPGRYSLGHTGNMR